MRRCLRPRFAVDQRRGMGETIQFLWLGDGTIDCCVNYTGNIWTTLMKRQGRCGPRHRA